VTTFERSRRGGIESISQDEATERGGITRPKTREKERGKIEASAAILLKAFAY